MKYLRATPPNALDPSSSASNLLRAGAFLACSRSHYRAILAAIALIGSSAQLRAATLSPTIQNFSSAYADSRAAVHCIDGSGLDTSFNPPSHTAVPDPNMWVNNGGSDPDQPAHLAHITFNLGGAFSVSSFRVWNYNELHLSNRSIRDLTISASVDGVNFTPIVNPSSGTTTWTFATAPGSTPYQGELITFASAVPAVYIRFDVLNNWSNGSDVFTGLSEIRFDGSPVGPAIAVTNTNDAGTGSLRDAITLANSISGYNTVTFAIPAADPGCNVTTGVCTITPVTPLPAVTDTVLIDGYTQPGAAPNTNAFGQPDNAAIKVELSGANLSSESADASTYVNVGITLADGSSGSTIRGLAINRFGDGAIEAKAASGNAAGMFITGNFIGIDAAGTTDFGNTTAGIRINSSPGNTIGGTAPADRNVISATLQTQNHLREPANVLFINDFGSSNDGGNTIQGNYIGTDATGTTRFANSDGGPAGVALHTGRGNNVVGGSVTGAANLISANGCRGGLNVGDSGNVIQGNLVGTTADGNSALGNGSFSVCGHGNGINIFGANNLVGGSAAAATNIVKYNRIGISDSGDRTTIKGNTASKNQFGITAGGTNGLIDANTISANSSTSATQGLGVAGSGNTASHNLIDGNLRYGIRLSGSGNTVGSNEIRNTILDNAFDSGAGINVGNGLGGHVITSNLIHGNAGEGIVIRGSDTPTGVTITGNAIYQNGRLGIDLLTCDFLNNCSSGANPNDVGDGDTGPNNFQNYPVLTSVSIANSTTTIAGNLNSTPNKVFRIELFASPQADAAGPPEGKLYLGAVSTDVTTDTNGNANFNFASTATVAAGDVISATATDVSTGDTSEFSAFLAAAVIPNATISGTITYNGNALIGATVSLSGTQSATATTDNAGAYSFSNLPAGTYSVTPSKLHLVFSPDHRNITLSGVDSTGQDFTASVAPPQTRSVSNTSDSGSGSLRQAVLDSNAGDTINFLIPTTDPNYANGGYTLTLTGAPITITTDLTITGPGADKLTVNRTNGNDYQSIFSVQPSQTVTISGMSLSNNGYGSGGSIYNSHGAVTVENCVIKANSRNGTGAIYNDGIGGVAPSLTVVNSVFADNGIAIYNIGQRGTIATVSITEGTFTGNQIGVQSTVQGGTGAVTVLSSTFTGNSSGSGPAIYNTSTYSGTATLNVFNSTFNGNTAGSQGGAISNIGDSGGDARLYTTNCTFSGNVATGYYGGAIYNEWNQDPNNRTIGSSVASIVDSTFVDNSAPTGGAIYNVAGTVSVSSSLFKKGASGANFTNAPANRFGTPVNGVISSNGYNLSSDDGSGLLVGTADQINKDPKIGPLQNNGGPTLTHALLDGSPALDAGSSDPASPTDQRGQPRAVNNQNVTDVANGSDVGAYEAPAPTQKPDLDDADDSGAFNTDNYTNVTAPHFTLTGISTGAFVELLRDGTVIKSGTATSTTIVFADSGLTDGQYVYTARQTVAGGLSPLSLSLAVTVDTTPPTASAPDLQAASDTGSSNTDNLTKAATRSFDVTTNEPNTTILLLRDGVTVDTAFGTSGANKVTDSSSTLADGSYNFAAKVIDLAGNRTSSSTALTVTLDRTAPTITVPSDIIAEATGAGGAAVTFTSSASDTHDGPLAASSSPASGSTFPIAASTVTSSATDLAGNTGSKTFMVTVRDTTPPVITVPASFSREATGPNGAVVTYSAPTASDIVDGSLTPGCDHSSGDTFALGNTTVTCSATDAHSNRSTKTFVVSVTDTTPPALAVPAPTPKEATGPSGAVITYSAPTATDIVDGSVTPVCDHASGDTFAVGNTTVTCSATDAHNNKSTKTFTVTVADSTPPLISNMPANIIAEATGPNGAAVSYVAPTASDIVDGAVTPACDHASGATYAFGATTVVCTATDKHSNSSSKSFTVTVRDTTPPVIINVPSNIVAEAIGASGAVVTYTNPTASDSVSGTVAVTSLPASGATFPIGTTTVTSTASDAAGNTATKSFTVTVRDTTAPTLTVPSPTPAEATGASGAVVTYAAPTATDLVDGSVTPSCDHVSGATYALGDTTVTCSATDKAANKSAKSFTVSVRDTIAPTITNAPDLTVQTTDPSGTTVTYTPRATDVVSGTVTVTCSPVSDSKFALGVSTVACSSTDGAGNKATKSFTVTMTKAPNITSASGTTFNVGDPGSFTVTTDASYPVAVALSASGAMPAGVSFKDNGNNTATISGTPGSGTEGSYSLTIIGKNGTLPNASQTFTLTVVKAAPTPTPSPTATPGPTATPSPTASPTASPTPSQPVNISTRGNVGLGDDVMIGGFIITGDVPKKVLIRGIGPSLSENNIGTPLNDPFLELYASSGNVIATNDDWRQSQESEIQQSGLAPRSDVESAIIATLVPGNYTAVVRGARGGTGIAVVEVYDLDFAAPAQLANISTRARVNSQDGVLIGGFILGGGPGERVNIVIRALGPSLAAARIAQPLADPTLDLRDANGVAVAFNDDWRDDAAQAAAISANGLAPGSQLESALTLGLPSGAYTVIVRGKADASGIGLVEVYHVK